MVAAAGKTSMARVECPRTGRSPLDLAAEGEPAVGTCLAAVKQVSLDLTP